MTKRPTHAELVALYLSLTPEKQRKLDRLVRKLKEVSNG